MFSRKQPGGVLTIVNIDDHAGDVWFVDSGHDAASDTAGFGQSPDSPCATIDYAVGLCTAGQGDVIYAMPGHAEVVIAAGGLDLDVAGITIKGLGEGTYQPTVTFTTDEAADMDVDAASITVENIHFVAGVADLTAAIDVNACHFTLRRCRFTGDNGGLNALIWIQDAAAAGSDRITVEDCYCMDVDTSNTHFINFAGTGYGHVVKGNTLIGDFGTMCIGGAGVVTYATIIDNVIYNAASTNDSCINFDATATGICMRNLCGGAAAQANGITATAMAEAENYYGVISEDLSAILDPIAT